MAKKLWTPAEEYIIQNAGGTKTPTDLTVHLPNRTARAIYQKSLDLGVQLKSEPSERGRANRSAPNSSHDHYAIVNDIRAKAGLKPLGHKPKKSPPSSRQTRSLEGMNLLSVMAHKIPRKIDGAYVTMLSVSETQCRTPLDVSGITSEDQIVCARPVVPGKYHCQHHGNAMMLSSKKGQKKKSALAA